MSSYVDVWEDSIHVLVKEVSEVAREISAKIAETLLAAYPGITS